MNTQKTQSSEIETVLRNVHPNRRKVLAAMILAASAGLPCAAAPVNSSTMAPAAAQVAINSVASVEGAVVWIVNEITNLTTQAQPSAYSKIKVSQL